MSPDLERLVGRAIMDKKFRKELLDDPDAAIAAGGFQLTPDELAKVREAVRQNAKTPPGQIDKMLDFETARGGTWT